MTQELTLLAWSVLVGLVQIGAAAIAKRMQEPRLWSAGSRDEPPPIYTGVAARLTRAQGNFLETFPLFAAAVLICHAAGREGPSSAWGAQLYFWGRVFYVPLYAVGIPYARTLVWLVAIAGLCMVLAASL